MKNSVKITIALGIVTSFFSVHPMAGPVILIHPTAAPNSYLVGVDELEQTNPLLDMNNLHITDDGPTPIHITYKNGTSEVLNARTRVRDDHPLYTDKGLALSLTALKVLKESDRIKNKKTLKTICDAVSEGTPVTSKYTAHMPNRSDFESSVRISPSQNPISIFKSIEDLFKYPSLYPFLFANSDGKKVDKKRLLMEAIFQGNRNRQERLAYIRDELTTDIRNTLEIEVPKDLTPIIIEYLPESNVSQERTRLIEQAEQKFDEEQQS